jgi:hypothetical protein
MTKSISEHWAEEARQSLVGRTVRAVRYLKKEEMDALGWEESVVVIEFDDGTLIFPSRDDEGNGGGAMFGQGPGNEELCFPVIRSYLMDRPAITGPQLSGPAPAASQTSRRSSSKKWEDKREKSTLRRLLKKIQGGTTEFHYNNERSLLELKEQGFIAQMAKFRKGRVPYFRVELSEEGKAA